MWLRCNVHKSLPAATGRRLVDTTCLIWKIANQAFVLLLFPPAALCLALLLPSASLSSNSLSS